MSAIPKLTVDEWNHARDVWEGDQRKGFPWLIEELALPVSAEAVRLKSKKENWQKSKKPSLEKGKNQAWKKGKKPSLETKVNKLGKTALKPSLKPKRKLPEKSDESVIKGNRKDSDHHGNSRYLTEYNEQVFRLCLLGATDKMLADYFDVSEQTINNWKKNHPDFFESIKRGKLSADSDVALSLFKRAIGCFHTATHISNFEGKITATDYIKYYPPDTKAATTWLRNRQPKYWRQNGEATPDKKFDKETLEELGRTYTARMEKSRERQDKLLLERCDLLDQESQK